MKVTKAKGLNTSDLVVALDYNQRGAQAFQVALWLTGLARQAMTYDVRVVSQFEFRLTANC